MPGAPGTTSDRVEAPQERVDLSDLLSELAGGIDAPTVGEELTNPLEVQRPERAAATVVESTGAIDFDPDFASFASRFTGFLVDALVTLVLMSPGLWLAITGGFAPLGVLGVVIAFAGFFVAATLSSRSVAASGQWIGNRVASTRVVEMFTGKPITVQQAFLRFVLRGLISPVFLFGFIVALTNPQRRAFHDQAAGSIVVRPARERWVVGDD